MQQIKYQKGFVVLLVITIVALLVVAGAAYFYVQSTRVCPAWGCGSPQVKDFSNSNSTDIAQQTSSDQSTSKIPNWKTYTNTNFSIQYPLGWSTVESSDGSSVIFKSPIMVGNSANSFEVSIEPIDNKRANVAGMVAAYSQLFGSKMQKSSLRLSSGQSATVLSMSDDSVPIHAMKIFFALNGNFYTISEGGPTYYNSPTFTQFYNSFEINN